MRPIDADALTEELSSLAMAITGLRAGKGVLRNFMFEYRKSVLKIVDEAPTIEAEPVRHGKWINKKGWSMGKWHKWLECSECKYQDYDLETYEAVPFTGPSNYCPHCGAKMDLE